MAYDASDKRHVRKAEKEAKNASIQAASFVRTAMASVEGRSWFLSVLERCNVFGTPFTANANATAFNCGIQNVGHWLLADIMAHAPDAYILMMRERNGRDSTSPDDRSSGRSANGDGRDSAGDSTDAGGSVASDYYPTDAARDVEAD